MPDFDLRVLEVLDKLAMYNGDVSYAADNVVQLAATPHTTYLDDELSDREQRRASSHLKTQSKVWYTYGDGVNSLIPDLLWQIIVTGALSAEIVPRNDLSGISKIVLIHPKNILFKYSKKDDLYLPYQKVSGVTSSMDGLVKLNPITYRYMALRRSNDRPYAIPPFMSALEDLVVTKDMKRNFGSVMKKYGALGFLEVLFNAPSKRQGEDDEAWWDRCQAFLDKHAPKVMNGVENGHVVGFKGGHEFNFQNVAASATGLKDLFEIQMGALASGLKQDPAMLSRHFSTTETLGRVILAKLSKQVSGAQRLVANFLEYAYTQELLLANFRGIQNVNVEFDAPMLGDAEKDEQAYSIKVDTYDRLYQQGVISQQQRSSALGFPNPDRDKPREVPALKPAPAAAAKPDGRTAPSKDAKTNLDFVILSHKLHASAPEYDYGSEHTCGDMSFSDRYADDKNSLNKYVREYTTDVKVAYRKMMGMVVSDAKDAVSALGNSASEQTLQDAVTYILYSAWEGSFLADIDTVVTKHIRRAYRQFSKDQEDALSMALTERDLRIIEYMARNDNYYLGKFVTDADTHARFVKMLKKWYAEEGYSVRDHSPDVGKFAEYLGDFLKGEEWKIERIVSTTMAKARAYAAIGAIADAEVEEFIILGIPDSNQCRYCGHMNGRVFSVSMAMGRIQAEASGPPGGLSVTSPFANSVFKTPDAMAGLNNSQLQASGIMVPFHPHCRCTVAANL